MEEGDTNKRTPRPTNNDRRNSEYTPRLREGPRTHYQASTDQNAGHSSNNANNTTSTGNSHNPKATSYNPHETCEACGRPGHTRSICRYALLKHPDVNHDGPWATSAVGKYYKSKGANYLDPRNVRIRENGQRQVYISDLASNGKNTTNITNGVEMPPAATNTMQRGNVKTQHNTHNSMVHAHLPAHKPQNIPTVPASTNNEVHEGTTHTTCECLRQPNSTLQTAIAHNANHTANATHTQSELPQYEMTVDEC
jgi:hypothetical protein